MSHVFISYSHHPEDKNKFDQLLSVLKENGFKDDGDDRNIWYDTRGIEVGEDWRIQIDSALENSFVIVVIVTPNSLKSFYVLYEWAWAIGNEIPAIPITFGNIDPIQLPIDFKHPLYERKQYKNWLDDFYQEEIIGQLKILSRSLRLESILGKRVSKMFLELRVFSSMAVWLCQHFYDQNIDPEKIREFIVKAQEKTHTLYIKDLPEFWFTHASVFTRKQARKYREILEKIQLFGDELDELASEAPFMHLHYQQFQSLIMKTNNYRVNIIEPLVEFFDMQQSNFRGFELYLEALSNKTKPSAFAIRYFGVILSQLSKKEEDGLRIRILTDSILETYTKKEQ
jgi:hypothetical protein